MTTYNGRRMRRRRTRAQLWDVVRPGVILLEVAGIVATLWWAGRLLGMV